MNHNLLFINPAYRSVDLGPAWEGANAEAASPTGWPERVASEDAGGSGVAQPVAVL